MGRDRQAGTGAPGPQAQVAPNTAEPVCQPRPSLGLQPLLPGGPRPGQPPPLSSCLVLGTGRAVYLPPGADSKKAGRARCRRGEGRRTGCPREPQVTERWGGCRARQRHRDISKKHSQRGRGGWGREGGERGENQLQPREGGWPQPLPWGAKAPSPLWQPQTRRGTHLGPEEPQGCLCESSQGQDKPLALAQGAPGAHLSSGTDLLCDLWTLDSPIRTPARRPLRPTPLWPDPLRTGHPVPSPVAECYKTGRLVLGLQREQIHLGHRPGLTAAAGRWERACSGRGSSCPSPLGHQLPRLPWPVLTRRACSR